MNFHEALKMAYREVTGNKLRTVLTMLGIIIGVSAVIIMVSVVQGTTDSVTERIQSMGTNLLSVRIMGRGADNHIEYEEALALSEEYGILGVAPVTNGNATIKYGTNTMDVSIEGADQNYSLVRNHGIQFGRFITPLDVEYRHKVALLGVDVVKELFDQDDPIGEVVKINGNNFTVVGVLEEKGSTIGGSSDETVLIPITTAQRLFKSTGIKSLFIQAESPELVDIAYIQVENFLLKRFKNDTYAFRIFNQSELLSTVNEVTQNMALMLGGIAAISLIVGGIGIMNIMLVSVTERTREIGIRKAIGAKRRDILIQFLIESAAISMFGGLLGVGVGILGNKLLKMLFSINTRVTLYILVIALSFSVIVGIFFGIYPANKASKLKPVDALRFE